MDFIHYVWPERSSNHSQPVGFVGLLLLAARFVLGPDMYLVALWLV